MPLIIRHGANEQASFQTRRQAEQPDANNDEIRVNEELIVEPNTNVENAEQVSEQASNQADASVHEDSRSLAEANLRLPSEDYSAIQQNCTLCGEPFSADDEFQNQFIECANCHRRWHPHPDADEHGNTSYCRCGSCHMFQNQLNAFSNVTEPEYLTGIGVEFIAERIRVLGKEHDAIYKLIERYTELMMKHESYLCNYIRLTDYLNRFIDMITLLKNFEKSEAIVRRLEHEYNACKRKRNKEAKARQEELSNQLHEARAQLYERRQRWIETHDNFSFNAVLEFTHMHAINGNPQALELIVNGFRYGIVIREMTPRIRLGSDDLEIAIKNRDALVSLYPDVFEIPSEFIDTFKNSNHQAGSVFRELMREHYKRIQESTPKLDLKFKRVGRCPTCEAAPVYIDENDEYRCSGCRARICKQCFKEIKENHVCRQVDIDEWSLIKEDTKACPNCGYRFGHHSRCNAMFCLNCYHGFDYESLKEIKGWFDNAERDAWAKRMGLQNTHIVATFRQLPTDIQIEVAKNVGKHMIAPFSNLVNGITGFYGRNRSINAFDEIKNTIITNTGFGKYKDNAVQILLCDVLKEVIIDYTIDILEVCEAMNEGRNRTVNKLVDNEVDVKMNRAAETLATIIKRLYYLFPVVRNEEIKNIEIAFISSIAVYANDIADEPSIAPLNDVFSTADCINMDDMLRVNYNGIHNAIIKKERNKPIVLEAATSIDDVFNEYKRRFRLEGEIEFQINLRRRYRPITRELNDETMEIEYRADGQPLTIEDAQNNNIRSFIDGAAGKPFKYADFVGKVIAGIAPVVVEEAPVLDEHQTDEEMIIRILTHFLAQYDEEYNRFTLREIQIWHRSFRTLRYGADGFYLIEHRTERVHISYEDFITRRIRCRGHQPVYVRNLVNEMRDDQHPRRQPANLLMESSSDE